MSGFSAILVPSTVFLTRNVKQFTLIRRLVVGGHLNAGIVSRLRAALANEAVAG
jgi:hypothetical protein